MRSHFEAGKWALFWAAFLAPGAREPNPEKAFFGLDLHPQIDQASAVWQWWNCAAGAASQEDPGLEVLRLNLDETSVGLFQGGGKGTIVCRKRRLEANREMAQPVNSGRKRTCLTHIALVCDRPDVQPLLPQVIIGNEATFKAGDLPALQAACPGNVHLLRQKSAWINTEVCVRVVRLLGAALRKRSHPPLVRCWQAVLLMDAHKAHYHGSVLNACWSEGIWPIIVPARMTWALQPLDTHAFKAYKERLREGYQRARLLTPTGELSMAQFLAAVCDTVRHVLQGRRWAAAFDQDGFGHMQASVSRTLLRRLQAPAPLVVPASMPTLQELHLCFPKRAVVPVRALLRPYQQRPQVAVAAPVLPRGEPLLPRRPLVAARPGPVTRSQTRSLAAALAKGPPLPRPPSVRRR